MEIEKLKWRGDPNASLYDDVKRKLLCMVKINCDGDRAEFKRTLRDGAGTWILCVCEKCSGFTDAELMLTIKLTNKKGG